MIAQARLKDSQTSGFSIVLSKPEKMGKFTIKVLDDQALEVHENIEATGILHELLVSE